MNTDPKGIVDPQGKPARAATKHCPQCGHDKREQSSGFGRPHDVCSQCGYEWETLTV